MRFDRHSGSPSFDDKMHSAPKRLVAVTPRNDMCEQSHPERGDLHALTIRFVDGEIFLAWRAESVEHARLVDCLDAVRNVARKIKRITGRKLVRFPIDNQSHPPLQNMDDLFLRVSMFRHFAAGIELSDHLIHRFPACHCLAFDAGANLDPGVFFFHDYSDGMPGNCRAFLRNANPIYRRPPKRKPYNLMAK